MKAVSDFSNIYLCREFVDFRKSINGLSAIVEADLSLDLRASALFIFANKRRTHLKMLYFDRSGFALWLKRLEGAGLITRTRSSEDERQVDIELTPKGRALRQEAEKIPPAIVAQLGMEISELESLHAALTKVIAAARRSGMKEI